MEILGLSSSSRRTRISYKQQADNTKSSLIAITAWPARPLLALEIHNNCINKQQNKRDKAAADQHWPILLFAPAVAPAACADITPYVCIKYYDDHDQKLYIDGKWPSAVLQTLLLTDWLPSTWVEARFYFRILSIFDINMESLSQKNALQVFHAFNGIGPVLERWLPLTIN